MASGTLNNLRILHKRYPTAEWASHKLQAGELGLDLTTKQVRIGTAEDQAWDDATPVGVKVVVSGSGNYVKNAVLEAATNTLTLTLGTLTAADVEGVVKSVKVTDDDVIVGTPAEKTNGDVVVDLKHKKAGPVGGKNSSANTDTTFNVPELTVDEYGHVNGFTEKEITLPDAPELLAGEGDGTLKLKGGADVQVKGWDELVARVNGTTKGYTYENRTDPLYEAALKDKNSFKVGDAIYFVDKDTPDQWVSKVLEEAAPETDYWYELQDIETDTDGIVHGTDLTAGALVLGNGGSTLKVLALGTEGQIIKVVDGALKFVDIEEFHLNVASKTQLGGIKIGAETLGEKEYPVLLNGSQQAYVKVDWKDTTYGDATSEEAGLVKLGSDTVQTEAAQAVSKITERTYAVQKNADGQLVVNVPWEDNNDNTTYTNGDGLDLTGTTFKVKLVDYTKAGNKAAYAAAGAAKFYAVQLDSDGKLGVAVPWANDTYTANNGLKLTDHAIGHENAAIAEATEFVFGAIKYNKFGHITEFQSIDTLDGNDAVTA